MTEAPKPTPSIAVAFIVREKFGWALPALKRLYRYVAQPFQLFLVDCGYPPKIRAEIDDFLQTKANVQVLESFRYLYPNEALNLVIAQVKEDYLCMIQNDVLIEEHFMDELLGTFQKFSCDIVWPMTYEIHNGEREPHRDEYTDTCIRQQGDRLLVQQEKSPSEIETNPERRIQHFEMHCLMFRTEAAKKLAPFPAINSREHIDCAVAAYQLGMQIYANERACANYVLPPIHDYDADYFSFRWDPAVADRSHREVAQRYGISPFPSAMGFVLSHGKHALRSRRIKSPPETSEIDTFLP